MLCLQECRAKPIRVSRYAYNAGAQNFNITNSIEVTIIGITTGSGFPLNRNATNDKNVTKKSCF